MAETYCGKACAECEMKEVLQCPGCRPGPGRQFEGDCELARCVRSKGHETCESCGFKGNCGTLRMCNNMPNYRRRKLEAEEAKKAAVAKRAVLLGQWLWVLFWLIIPGTIAGIMTQDSVVKLLPGLFLPGQILNAVVSVVYGLILIKISVVEDRYRTAGLCSMIASLITILVAIFAGSSGEANWTLLITLPASIAALVGEYNEYMAHAIVLNDVDKELSENWRRLWKWYIGLFLGMFGCIFVTVIVPFLGLLVLLAVAVGLIVVDILKLVYLYKTAKCFREYPVKA